jgi:hypothetical protein
MHAFVIGLGLTLATAAVAQQPAGQPAVQAIKTFASSAGVVALVAQAKSERKEGQALVSEYILRLPPHHANLEYRASIGTAAVHEREAELFYVIDAAATMVTSGKLGNEAWTNAENRAGTAIEWGDVAYRRKRAFHYCSAKHATLV